MYKDVWFTILRKMWKKLYETKDYFPGQDRKIVGSLLRAEISLVVFFNQMQLRLLDYHYHQLKSNELLFWEIEG